MTVLIVLNRPAGRPALAELACRRCFPAEQEDVPDRARCSRCGRRRSCSIGLEWQTAAPAAARPGPGWSPAGWASASDAVRAAFGRLDMPELPEVYDAAGLLDLPERGRPVDPDVVRRALLPYVFKEPEPRPALAPARRDLAAAAGAGLDDSGSLTQEIEPR